MKSGFSLKEPNNGDAAADMVKKKRNSNPPSMGGWNRIELPRNCLKQLGQMPDTEIAKQLNVSKSVIARARRNLKIKAFPCQTRFKKGDLHPRWKKRKEDNYPADPRN